MNGKSKMACPIVGHFSTARMHSIMMTVGPAPEVVVDNGAFRYDATLFSRDDDKRHLLLLLRRCGERERERLFSHKTAIDDAAALNSESEHGKRRDAADQRIPQRD